MAIGVRVRHASLTSCVALVPLLHKPFTGQSLDLCPSCRVVHPVKTVHLWLDDTGSCLVSEGVLEDLRAAGMPELTVVGHTDSPPPLRIRAGVQREQIDQSNRQITISR